MRGNLSLVSLYVCKILCQILFFGITSFGIACSLQKINMKELWTLQPSTVTWPGPEAATQVKEK